MSFWDTFADDSETSLASLLTADPIDYEAILLHQELFSTYRSKDTQLLMFLSEHVNEFIDAMLNSKNEKVSKASVELFTGNNSPLLINLIQNQQLSEEFISKIPSLSLVKMGYISRIFIKAFETKKSETTNLFAKSKTILVVLTKYIDINSIYDLIHEFVSIPTPDNHFLIFAYIRLLCPKGGKTPPELKTQVTEFVSNFSDHKFNEIQYSKLLETVYTFVTLNKEFTFPNTFPAELGYIYATHKTNSVHCLIMKIAIEVSGASNVFENIAIKLVQRNVPYGELSVLALEFLSRNVNESLVDAIPIIIERFIEGKINTFHQSTFVKFILSAINVPKLREVIVQKLVPLILENANRSNWRKNANVVGFYLQLASIIDEYVGDQNEQWNKFRINEIKEWTSGKEGLMKNGMKTDGNDAFDLPPNKKEENFQFPTFSDEPMKREEKFEFPTFDDEPAKKEEEKIVFPSFEDEPKKEEKIEFPSFEDEPAKKEEEKIVFPSFDDKPKEEEKIEFPSFEDEPEKKEEKIMFPSFADEPKKEETFQFPTFSDEPTKKEDKFEFPTFDDEPAEKEEKIEFPSFEDEPEKKEEKIMFPSFADEPKKEETFQFPTFSDEPTKKEDKFEFPTFDDEPAEKEEKIEFPSFEDEPKKEEKIEFPSFADEPDKKEEKIEFPSFADEPKKEESFQFPTFDDEKTPKKSENNFAFPSFSDEPNQKEEKIQFPSFEDENPKKNDEKISFPSFDDKPKTENKTSSNETTSSGVDISFTHFLELINNPCWEYNGPSPSELFSHKEEFSTPEEAFDFLIKQ
ncbi:hypothetical protein GPJ56_010083 [Histomonas meleagridis]|uniref:uncharacterized protein n=1 Tax=Histomonas meleagridis TaxID=135588 RepID=UPI00355AC812|nr:hypothetical protein GPJ56_010083 [Histomonas meleagridis]KAH0806739.1 hypothetical protein GO595_000382 [Histomonas meleagridis]